MSDVGRKPAVGLARRMKMAGLGTMAVGAALAAAAGTSLVSASASTHWYNTTTIQHPSPLAGVPGTVLLDSALVQGHFPGGPPNKNSDAAPPAVTFTLFGPGSAQCTGANVFSKTVLLNLHNRARLSSGFTVAQAGTYSWLASYNGNSDNRPSSSCEALTIQPSGGTQGTTTGGGGGSGTLALSTGPGVPATGVANGGVQGFYAFPGGAEVGVAGLVGGGLMLMAGPPLFVLARRSRRHLTRD